MDYPANARTNVHVVENVKSISWSQWAWTARQTPTRLEDEQDEQLAAIAVAYNLRETHSHVFWDIVAQNIWLFVPTVSPKSVQDEQVFAHYGYSKISHGTLQASDIGSAGPVYLENEDNVGQVLSATVSENHASTGETTRNVASTFHKAMIAISSTFSHHLAKLDDWKLVGPATCIKLPAFGEAPFEQSWFEASGGETNLINFLSRWDADCRLTIFSNLSRSKKLCTAAHQVHLARHSLSIGDPLLLSPSGVHVIYRGVLSIADERKGSQDAKISKMRCTTYLNAQGLSISPNADWIIVEVPPTCHPQSSQRFHSEPPLLTLWPAEYVLCRDETGSKQMQNVGNLEPSGLIDPVARAEAWYLGSATRAKKVEAVQKEADRITGQQQTQRDVSDIEVLSEIASPHFQDVVPQDVSGIYPTPPDGVLSQPSVTPVSYGDHESPPGFAAVDQLIGPYIDADRHDANNDDLFGDMDMDMVGEADFNFFDEPGVASEGSNAIAQDVPPEKIVVEKYEDIPPGMASVSLLADKRASQGSPKVEIVPQDKKHSSAVDASSEQPMPTTDDCNTSMDGGLLQVAPVMFEVDGEEASEGHSPLQWPQHVSMSVEDMNLGRGSFNSKLPVNLDIDRKYRDNGRFGHPPGTPPNFGPPAWRKLDKYHQIPQIGLKQNSLSSPDSQDEGDEVYDEDDEDDNYGHDNGMSDKWLSNVTVYDISEDLRQMSELISRKWERAADATISQPPSPPSPESTSGDIEQGPSMEPSFPPSAFFNIATKQTLTDSTLWTLASDRPLYTSDEHNFIQVAQVLTDQVAREGIRSSFPMEPPSDTGCKSHTASRFQQYATSIVSGAFSSSKVCHLQDLIDAAEEEAGTSQNIHILDSLPMRVQRMGNMTDILPSATPFWEGLSLCPSSGSKDVYAFCVFPKIDHLVQPSKTFLEMVKGAYQTCNLGRHSNDGPQSAYPLGLVPMPTMMVDTKGSLAKLGRHLAGLRLCGSNYIIYMLDYSEDDRAMPGLCNAFLDLFRSYRLALQDEELRNPNDLVLQIVPSRMVFARNKLVLPSPSEYKRLAFQVYDRCGPKSGNGQAPASPFASAPAMRLSKPVPKVIDFKLDSDYSSALSDDCLHLAYKWEDGQQWLTASWTNNLGSLQWNAAYWLSQHECIKMTFSQAAAAMLDVTNEMLGSRQTPCTMNIAKDGMFEAHEVETWVRLRSEKVPSLVISLLEINPNPSLELFPPSVPFTVTDPSDLLTTPTPTPHATGQSPDATNHNQTPGTIGPQGALSAASVESDADARLIDIVDETWAAIMHSAKVQMEPKTSAEDPVEAKAKPRGYLIKRAGTHDEDGLLLVQVDIVHGSEPQQPLLLQILTMYRNLASLARVRNIIDPIKGTLPIHVAAAGKAYTALCKSMRYA